MIVIPIFLPEHSCPYNCHFCSLEAANGPEAPVVSPAEARQVVEAQLKQMDKQAANKVEVAFYGGTFTRGGAKTMAPWLKPMTQLVRDGHIDGIRVSTRPDRLDADTVDFLKQAGVTTMELGVQSLDDDVLTSLGRGHSAACAIRAVNLCKESGLITGVHLMTGMAAESDASWRKTISGVIDLRPHMVRIHPLLILKNTRFARDDVRPLSDDVVLDRLAHALLAFEQAGIPVTRVGLQPTDSLRADGVIVAGLFHPALRHRAMSRLYGRLLDRLGPAQDSEIGVSPAHLSYAIGFKREQALARPDLSFRPDDRLKPWGLTVNGTWYHMASED